MATTRIRIGNVPKKFSIAVGDTLEILIPRNIGGAGSSFGSMTFTALPGAGGTLDVEFSTSPYADLEAGTGTWADWASGVASAVTTDSLIGPITGLRATAVTQAGVLETVT